MTWDEFDRWSPQSVRGAADQLVASGLLPEPEATAWVGGRLADQLPSGIATPLHHLWTVHSPGPDGPTIGHLWLRVRPSAHEVEAFVLDIDIAPELRGRGWGRSAMLAVEQRALDAGASVVRLNVYAHNTAGVRLYEGLGYDVAGSTMTRCLDGRSPATPAGRALQPTVTLHPVSEHRHPGSPDHRLWQAREGADPVADVWLQLARRSDGCHAFLRELRVTRPDRFTAVVDAAVEGARALDARSLTVSVPESLPDSPPAYASQELVERCGFRVVAATMARRL